MMVISFIQIELEIFVETYISGPPELWKVFFYETSVYMSVKGK